MWMLLFQRLSENNLHSEGPTNNINQHLKWWVLKSPFQSVCTNTWKLSASRRGNKANGALLLRSRSQRWRPSCTSSADVKSIRVESCAQNDADLLRRFITLKEFSVFPSLDLVLQTSETKNSNQKKVGFFLYFAYKFLLKVYLDIEALHHNILYVLEPPIIDLMSPPFTSCAWILISCRPAVRPVAYTVTGNVSISTLSTPPPLKKTLRLRTRSLPVCLGLCVLKPFILFFFFFFFPHS